MGIKVQQTYRLECDDEHCREKEVFSGFFEIGATKEDVLDVFLGQQYGFSSWHMFKGRLHHSYAEDDDV